MKSVVSPQFCRVLTTCFFYPSLSKMNNISKYVLIRFYVLQYGVFDPPEKNLVTLNIEATLYAETSELKLYTARYTNPDILTWIKNPAWNLKKIFMIFYEKSATLSAVRPYKRVPRDILQWIVEGFGIMYRRKVDGGFGGNVQQKNSRTDVKAAREITRGSSLR